MRENIRIIKFLSLATVISALITYAVTVNVEMHFCVFGSPFISNNFILTIAGGAFASFLVTLLYEVQKYMGNKAECEDKMFYYGMYLYLALYCLSHNALDLLNAPPETIAVKGFFQMHTQNAQSQMMGLERIDYTPFCSKDKKKQCFASFLAKMYGQIQPTLNLSLFFDSTVIEDHIANLQSFGKDVAYSADPKIAQTLHAFHEKYEAALEVIDSYLIEFDDHCSNKYNWKLRKETLQKNYTGLFPLQQWKNF